MTKRPPRFPPPSPEALLRRSRETDLWRAVLRFPGTHCLCGARRPRYWAKHLYRDWLLTHWLRHHDQAFRDLRIAESILRDAP